jgi:response regulator RpfG family c-di-GMP phosphodiesterase
MLDTRPYKKPYSINKIIQELMENSGKMYDPKVVEAFLTIIHAKDLVPPL